MPPVASNCHSNGSAEPTPAALETLIPSFKLMDVLRRLWRDKESGWKSQKLQVWLTERGYQVERCKIPGRWKWVPEHQGALWVRLWLTG